MASPRTDQSAGRVEGPSNPPVDLPTSDSEFQLPFLERVWVEWQRSAHRPFLGQVVTAVSDGRLEVSELAARLLITFSPPPLEGREDLQRALASEVRQVRLQAAQVLLTLLPASSAVPDASDTDQATEGLMAPTESPSPPAATNAGRANPTPSLILAVALAGVSLSCVAVRTWTDGPQAVYVLAAFAALGSYAFLTRWIQRVDRSGSRFLQFLERVRCYLAHEDPAGTAKPG